MRHVISIALLALLMGFTAVAQPVKKSEAAEKSEQELMQLERDWSAAFLSHDTATIDRILAEDFVGIDGRGIVTDKVQEIKEAQGPQPGEPQPAFSVLEEIVTDMKVRLYGNVGVVNGRIVERLKSKDRETTIQYRRTTVWVKRLGRWKCVSFHGSRILDPPKP